MRKRGDNEIMTTNLEAHLYQQRVTDERLQQHHEEACGLLGSLSFVSPQGT